MPPFDIDCTIKVAMGSLSKPISLSSSVNHSIVSPSSQSIPGLNVSDVPVGAPLPNLSPAVLKKKLSVTVIVVLKITKPSCGCWSGLVVFDMVSIKGSIGDFLITVVCL